METNLEQLVGAARGGGPTALRAAARLMSIMTDQPQRLAELLAGSRDWPQPRLVLGVTGAPGSGKSTLVDHSGDGIAHADIRSENWGSSPWIRRRRLRAGPCWATACE